MALFFGRKKTILREEQHDFKSELEVAKLKQDTHLAAKQANDSINKVNKRLISNGITLNISVAIGAHNGKH